MLASFLFSLFLCQTLIFPLPPSASGFRQGSDSNNRPVSGQTKLGSISIHFQGATTAVRERVRVEKELGGGGVYARYGGRSVEGAKPDMTVEKQLRIQEEIEQWGPRLHCVLVFEKLFRFGSEFFNFLFVHPPAFCPFLLPLGGESSVFINREDTSISVAVMHTG